MKKIILYIIIVVMLSSFAFAVHSNLTVNGETIDLSSSPNPKGYANENNTYNYILSSSSALYRYEFDNWSFVKLVGSSGGLSFIGSYHHEFNSRDEYLMIYTSTGFRQFYDTGSNLGNVNSYNINSYTTETIGIIADVEIDTENNRFILYDRANQSLHFFDFDTTINNLLDISFVYSVDISDLGMGASSTQHMMLYNDEIYIYDIDNETIFRLSNLGDIYQIFTLPSTTDIRKDIFIYNNTLWVIEENTDLARGYEITITPPPFIVDGQTYNAISCTGNNINSDSPSLTGRLCSNTSLIIDELGNAHFGCPDGASLTTCINGCTPTVQDDLSIKGVCEPQACENECDLLNEQICLTENTYSICTEGADGCYDLTGALNCPINQYCSLGQCDTVSINKSGLWTQEGLVVSSKIEGVNTYNKTTSTTETLYDIWTSPSSILFPNINKKIKQVLFKSIDATANINFEVLMYPNADKYSGTSCNFINNNLENDFLTHNDLIGYGWTTSNTITEEDGIYYLDLNNTDTTRKTLQETTLSQEIEIMIEPRETGTTLITIKDNDYQIGELEITYNSTAKNILIRETYFDKLIVNETSIQPTDDLQRVVIVGRHLKNIDSSHYEILTIRNPSGEDIVQRSFSLPIQYSNTLADTATEIIFNKTDSSVFRIYQIIQYEQEGYPSFSTLDTNYTVKGNCEFINTGCKNARVYGNNQAIPTYHFFEDVKVCVSELEGIVDAQTQSEDDTELDFLESFLGRKFTDNEKLLIAVSIIGLVFGAFGYMYVVTEPKEKIFLIGGSVISLILMFYFASISYIPAWVIVLQIIIAGGLVGYFTTRGN